jgi:hypothetical protein
MINQPLLLNVYCCLATGVTKQPDNTPLVAIAKCRLKMSQFYLLQANQNQQKAISKAMWKVISLNWQM